MHPLKHPIPPQPHSLFVSWPVPRDRRGGGGGRPRAGDGEGGGVCVKLDPLIQKPSLGTTAGTRLLLGLSTVAPQEQQKTPPNAACSSSLNTHIYTHTYGNIQPRINTQHTQGPNFSKQLIVFSVEGCTCMCYERIAYRTFPVGRRRKKSERAVNCNKVDSWTAGSMLGSHGLCMRASTHACVTVRGQCSAVFKS